MGQFAPSSPVPAGKLHPAKSPRWLRIFHRRWQSSSAIKVCMSVCEGERESERERKRERERERVRSFITSLSGIVPLLPSSCGLSFVLKSLNLAGR